MDTTDQQNRKLEPSEYPPKIVGSAPTPFTQCPTIVFKRLPFPAYVVQKQLDFGNTTQGVNLPSKQSNIPTGSVDNAQKRGDLSSFSQGPLSTLLDTQKPTSTRAIRRTRINSGRRLRIKVNLNDLNTWPQ